MKIYKLTTIVNYKDGKEKIVEFAQPCNQGGLEDVIIDYLNDNLASSFIFAVTVQSGD